jgi:uncharacterized protein
MYAGSQVDLLHPIKALVIADHRPGHYHISEGIVAAAQRLRPIQITRLEIRRRFPGRVLAALTNIKLAPHRLLRFGYDIKALPFDSLDLVVSSGAETLAANIAISRLFGARNVFYGSLRQFRPEDFSLVLTSYVEHAGRPRHVMTLKPSALRFPPGTKEIGEGNLSRHPTAALLIGGNSGECKYSALEWTTLLGFVTRSHAALGIVWKISNSRRTPPDVSDALAAEALTKPDAIRLFVDVRTAGSSTLACAIEDVEFVLCTDDSSSMISEAASAHLPVIGVSPRSQALTSQEQGYRNFLSQNGWYRSVALTDLTPERLLNELSAIKLMNEDPLDGLSEVLSQHLPSLFCKAGDDRARPVR